MAFMGSDEIVILDAPLFIGIDLLDKNRPSVDNVLNVLQSTVLGCSNVLCRIKGHRKLEKVKPESIFIPIQRF